MSLLITIRTADRRPKRNYLRQTLEGLIRGGVDVSQVQVFPTDPAIAWLITELAGLPRPVLHVPDVRRSPNVNGVAQVSALDGSDATWIVMLEDDVSVCADFEGSVSRWLARHAVSAVKVYRFCAFGTIAKTRREVAEYPLREQRGSQAIALRATDARAFAAWATEHHDVWRPRMAPFQNQRQNGFDKLVGYWALASSPSQQNSYVSRPMFVRHIGRQSLLHPRTVTNDTQFAGERWSYPVRATA